HLGWAAKELGKKVNEMLVAQRDASEIRDFLNKVYNGNGKQEDLASLGSEEILELAKNLSNGIPFATPVFDGAHESEIKYMLKLADLPESGQTILYDGRTGDAFDRPVT